MAYEDRSRSLVTDEPDILVYIPEAAEPGAERVVVVDHPAPRVVPWIERSEAPWIILGAAALLVAVLILFPRPTVAVSATPATGVRPVTTVDAGLPIWTALAVPVPESFRTHTVNVAGSVDVLEIADLGPGAALSYTGNVTTVDGPVVQQLFGNHFLIASPTGATIVAYMPYPAGSSLILDPGEEVTFVGTLMPVPEDFAAMVGPEAGAVGSQTGVYVRVVPETLRTVTVVPETS
jgi:hypothetical protein